jgi:hypothetical protein
MRAVSLLCRVPVPPLTYAPTDEPGAVLSWIQKVLRSKREAHLFTFASAATQLCQVAQARGLDLTGLHFTLVGEPVTETRLRVIRASGAEGLPRYAANECGTVGYGCLTPTAPDDLHLMDDLQALILAEASLPEVGLPPGAVLVSSLHPTAPFLMLNVSLGDLATLVARRCGCPLEQLGWTTHLQTIQSFEKLTSGGLAYLDAELVRVLEEVLPDRFGGGPADYQLVEDASADGQPRLRLLIHPSVGDLDPGAVSAAFLEAVGAGSGIERLTALLWSQAGFLRIERRAPYSLASGKVRQLHRLRRSAVVHEDG